jgi:LAO/AO transport system kinase
MQYLEENSITVKEYVTGIRTGDPVILGKALSLVESQLEKDLAIAMEVLEQIFPDTGNSIRVGITGAPGVGKSTFIEVLGGLLVDAGHKIAVLTVDPTSQRSGGSILGDKTRMEQLSKSERAFIRPSAAGDTLGGVAHHTRESILLFEAAGYDVILVETVGVGQSEIMVREMVDFFLLLMIAGAGDELQGIKKGIIEMADTILITKADEDNLPQATQTQVMYKNALHLLSGTQSYWQPKVLTCSSKYNEGIDNVWSVITDYQHQMVTEGQLEAIRQQQRVKWMEDCLKLEMQRKLEHKKGTIAIDKLRKQVGEGSILPKKAAIAILGELQKSV